MKKKLSKEGKITAYAILKCPTQMEDTGMLEVREALEKVICGGNTRVL